MNKITKAVFPVAGMGTRFLPATKASPKEMMSIVDKPLIQFAVEEAIAAGFTELIFITGRNKRAIEDHFDKAYELEAALEATKRDKLLRMVRNIIPKNVSCIYIRQPEAKGLGHAVLCARSVVGDEPFAVILADELIDHEVPAMKQMVDLFDDTHCSILGVQEVPLKLTEQYGIVRVEKNNMGLQRVTQIVEKPKPSEAPSNLAVVGRYILTPHIFNQLLQVQPGAGNEIQLTDAIAALREKEQIIAQTLKGKRFDCGSKIGFLKATINYGMKHEEVGADFTRFLLEQGCQLEGHLTDLLTDD